jgi:hypothetical protein
VVLSNIWSEGTDSMTGDVYGCLGAIIIGFPLSFGIVQGTSQRSKILRKMLIPITIFLVALQLVLLYTIPKLECFS